jgi:polyphenol oxidase
MAGLFRTIAPSWKISGVHACTFLAKDSEKETVSFSLRTELGKECRENLENILQPLQPIVWLQQVHGNDFVELPLESDDSFFDETIGSKPNEIRPIADACYTMQAGVVCAILTADCLPVVLARIDGTAVAAIHAGRRGLENGIIPRMVEELGAEQPLYAWIGPGISASSYPISYEIMSAFLEEHPQMSHVFKPSPLGDYCMDLVEVARLQLLQAGVSDEHISIAVRNTFTDPELHSARRDGEASGRMATLVWMD